MTTDKQETLLGNVLAQTTRTQRTEVLEMHAAEVLISARILGELGAAKNLGTELFGKPLSRTPIRKIIEAIESGELPITKANLEDVVRKDAGAMKFFQTNPWLTDPKGEGRPLKKTGRIPKSKKGTYALPADPRAEPDEVKAKAEPAVTPAPATKPTEGLVEPTPKKPETEPKPKPEPEPPSVSPAAEKSPAKNGNDVDWEKLSREIDEQSRRPPPPKVTTKSTLPKYKNPPLPPGGTRVSTEDRDAYVQAKAEAVAAYKAMALEQGYVIDPAWNGYGDPIFLSTPD